MAQMYEHIVKELLIAKEVELAQFLIKEQTSPVLGDFPQLLQQLWDLTLVRDPPHSFQSLLGQKYEGYDQAREALATAFDSSVFTSEEQKNNRLLQLLAYGIEYERQLKGGIKQQVQRNNDNKQLKQGFQQETQKKNKYVQKIVSHKIFQGDFKVQSLIISKNGQYLVLGGSDGLIEVWNYQKMQLELSLPYQASDLYMLHRKAVLSLLFSNDDKILASGDAEGIIKIWKFSDGKKLREIDTQGGDKSGITALALNSNNSNVIAGCLDQSIKVYGLKSGNLLKEIKGHDSFIQQIYLIPQQENMLISASENGQIILWNLQGQDQKSQKIKQIETPAMKLKKDLLLNSIQINLSNPNELLISNRFKSAYLIDIESNKVLQEYASNQSRDEEVLYATFSGDYNFVYTYTSTKNLYIYNKKSGKLESMLLVPNETTEITGMEVSQDQNAQADSMVIYSLNNVFKLEANV